MGNGTDDFWCCALAERLDQDDIGMVKIRPASSHEVGVRLAILRSDGGQTARGYTPKEIRQAFLNACSRRDGHSGYCGGL